MDKLSFRQNRFVAIGVFVGFGLWGCATTSTPSSTPPPSSAECPQPKFTGRAPDAIYNQRNPIAALDAKVGEKLYFDEAPGRYSCSTCHGRSGNGKGPMSSHFIPPPRNLACIRIANIPEGQVFWTIKNGSPGTEMPAHKHFSDEQIWQIVGFIKSF